LGALDHEAWEFLKNEAVSLLSKRCPERNWEQLFNRLNEAKSYKLLKDLGCKQVTFIPRSEKDSEKTPDLEGILFGDLILCEVKTINVSGDEITKRKNIIPRDAEYELSKEFFDKFDSTLDEAESQLLSYRKSDPSRRIVYFVIHFDEPLALMFDGYRTAYGRQLRDHIVGRKSGSVEIKVHGLLP